VKFKPTFFLLIGLDGMQPVLRKGLFNETRVPTIVSIRKMPGKRKKKGT
jgi:hypothetical protein